MRPLLVILLLLVVAELDAQTPSRRVRVALYFDDGTAASGELRSIDERELLLARADSLDRIIALDGVRMAALLTERRSELGTLLALSGTYIGIALPGDDPRRGLFVDGDLSTIAGGVIGSMVGGVAGLAAQPRLLDDRIEYALGGAASRARFVADARAALTARSLWVFTVHGGIVDVPAVDERRRWYLVNGYGDGSYRSRTLAMLRRVELSRSVLERVDVSAAFVSMSSPDLEMIIHPALRVSESYRGWAGLVGARYRLPFSSRPGALVARGGIAGGIARVEARRFDAITGEGIVPVALGSFELTTALDDWLVAGVSAEWLLASPFDVEGNPVIGVPSESLTLSSTSIGFTIGTTF